MSRFAKVRFDLVTPAGHPAGVLLADQLPLDLIPEGVDIVRSSDVTGWIKTTVSSTYAFTKGDDPAFLIYTSGTTAEPKGVLNAQRSILGLYGQSTAPVDLNLQAFGSRQT